MNNLESAHLNLPKHAMGKITLWPFRRNWGAFLKDTSHVGAKSLMKDKDKKIPQ